jgi:DNA adenine methylase
MDVQRIAVPPIKCQGIKTKLVPFIAESIEWNGHGRWIEPFAGSGVVAFSLAPQAAILSDTNPFIIGLYQKITSGELTPEIVRHYLEREGKLLRELGGDYYYEVRDRFNESGEVLDFLFLNRSCFNGVIRFNRKGMFNVPFNHKPERFAPAYVTKIVNQVDRLAKLAGTREWEFRVADWRETLGECRSGDFVYADPPYIARFRDYYDSWDDEATTELLTALSQSPAGFAFSTWSHNRHRENPLIAALPEGCVVLTTTHFYHVGATEALRNSIEEALVVSEGFQRDSSTESEPDTAPTEPDSATASVSIPMFEQEELLSLSAEAV